ncbi:unnamed protein product, partial [Lampetra fluviatilis]
DPWHLLGRRVYRPLLQRPRCEALEQRIEHYARKRRRLDTALGPSRGHGTAAESTEST